MKTSKRNRHRSQSQSTLMITPMIDMFTVILIFLIVSYAPEQSKIKVSENITVPKSPLKLKKVPQVQVEVTENYIMINGERLQSLKPSQAQLSDWKVFKDRLSDMKQKDEAVLVMADKSTNFAHVDRAIAHLASAGFSEVYFLTETEPSKDGIKLQGEK